MPDRCVAQDENLADPARQRLLYEDLATSIHALSLTTLAPDEI